MASAMAMRVALNDAAPLYRDAPEALQARAAAERTMALFMEEVLPQAPAPIRALAGDLVTTTFSAVGKAYSETPRSEAEIATYADAVADMLCAYLNSLQAG